MRPASIPIVVSGCVTGVWRLRFSISEFHTVAKAPRFCKRAVHLLRQRFSLLTLNVDNRCYYVLLRPKTSLAALPDPRSARALPTTCLSHLASGVAFERVENYFRITVRSHHGMHVVVRMLQVHNCHRRILHTSLMLLSLPLGDVG